MSHKTRVERHITIDVLASVVGGMFVSAVLNKSGIAFALTAAIGVTLFLLERNNIKEEDELDTPHEVFVETLVQTPPQLTADDLKILRRTASHPASEDILEEGLAYYIAGLEDGAAVNAQWVLNQVAE